MTKRILIYTPTDEASTSVTAYGHQFTAGVPLDLGEDEAAYERLKSNPEFTTDGALEAPKVPARTRPATDVEAPLGFDDRNDGEDAATRAVLQKRAILSLKPQAAKGL